MKISTKSVISMAAEAGLPDSLIDELSELTPEIRIEGIRGDDSHYPWVPWKKETYVWFKGLPDSDREVLKKGDIMRVRSFFCLIEEVRLCG